MSDSKERDVNTGFFVRARRDGRWQAVDIGTMSSDEREEFFSGRDDLLRWVDGLLSWIRSSVVWEKE